LVRCPSVRLCRTAAAGRKTDSGRGVGAQGWGRPGYSRP
jgi:hypothetical protein